MPAPSPTAPTQGALPVAAAPAARPEPPLALAQAAPSAVQPALASPPSAAAPGHAPLRADRRAPPKAVLAKAPSRRRGSGPIAQPASCERNAVGVGCRRAVIQADRHLRAVYENAVRRGVPHGVLVDYRDRWADLRESGSDDPVRLIESYGALAYDLGREARDQEAAAAPRRGSSGWRAVADAFRPLPLR